MNADAFITRDKRFYQKHFELEIFEV